VQFAQMGAVFFAQRFAVPEPRVALLSIGEEPTKGTQLVKETHAMLGEPGRLATGKFLGNVEGRDVLSDAVDVVVTDGFTGNVVVKLAEGLGSLILGVLREELTANLPSKILAAGLKPAFGRVRARMDYAEYGGAALFGVQGLVIKAHGRSNARAIRSAIRVARQAAERGTLAAFQEIGTAPQAVI